MSNDKNKDWFTQWTMFLILLVVLLISTLTFIRTCAINDEIRELRNLANHLVQFRGGD